MKTLAQSVQLLLLLLSHLLLLICKLYCHSSSLRFSPTYNEQELERRLTEIEEGQRKMHSVRMCNGSSHLSHQESMGLVSFI